MNDLERNKSRHCDTTAISREIDTRIFVTASALHAESNQGNIAIPLEEQEILFVRFLVENPNRAFLGSELHQRKPDLLAYSGSSLYSGVASKIGPHAIRDNFIAFGQGKAKRYGFLIDSKDPTDLIAAGRRSIQLSEYSERRKSKQLRSYDELEAFYSGSEDRKYSRTKLLGATALGITITVGGTMYLIYKNNAAE